MTAGYEAMARSGGQRAKVGSGVRRGLFGMALVIAATAGFAAGAGDTAGPVAGQASERGAAQATQGAQVASGRAIYLEGRLADGSPLRGQRAGGLGLAGAAAACVNCHRRSGLGGAEGRSYVAPIDAASLFAVRPPGSGASASGIGRPAYDDATLARAIRQGLDAGGRRLDFLMPRYALDDAALAELLAYLRTAGSQAVPGLQDGVLQLATVIAPGSEPGRAAAMRDGLAACVAEHNAGPPPERGRRRLGPGQSRAAGLPWRLAVWELHGEPASWPAQLAEHARTQPAFALLGGLGRGDWGPVHRYCEAQAVPCLFPHVEAPVAADRDFYNLYLSGGVLLEAGLIAQHLKRQAEPLRVLQLLRNDDAAAVAAADALRQALAGQGVVLQERRLGAAESITPEMLAGGEDTLRVFWLRGTDLAALADIAPGTAPAVFSATLAGASGGALPPVWKSRAWLAYPYELPQRRQARLQPAAGLAGVAGGVGSAGVSAAAGGITAAALGGVAADDDVVRGDAAIACAAFGAAMNELAGHLQRDYLIERLEVITGRGRFAGHYPQLALGAGQRFASKSGYLVRFADADSGHLEPLGERTAP